MAKARCARTGVRCSHDDVDDPRIETTRMVTLVRRPSQAVLCRRTLPSSTAHCLHCSQDSCSCAISSSIVRDASGSRRPRSTTANFELGQPLDGSAIGVVIDALGSAIAARTVVRHRLGWREHAVVEAAAVSVVDVDAAPAGAWLGILGQTGFTAYVGLTRIAQMRPGDVVFISAAAGAVGSAAGRFAKLLGAARVIGSAGGTTKVRALVDELGYDDAFDRAEAARDALCASLPMASTCTSTTSGSAARRRTRGDASRRASRCAG